MMHHPDRFKGKVAVVTGAAQGIGRMVAVNLAKEGGQVALVDRSEVVNETHEEIAAAGADSVAILADLEQYGDACRVMAEAKERFGRIDILINNVGMGGYRPFLEWSEADYDKIMATNAKSTWLFSKEVVPHMLKQGGGNIVMLSSVAGLQGYPSEGIYCMSKFAQTALAQSLDREFYKQNIKVSLVCPGGTETHFAIGDGRTHGGPNMSGFSTAEDVAEAVILAVLPRDRTRVVNVILRPMNEMT
jgi:meso-butanediol dehydrogenase/(S,S)-butanediol dehydrogenase/diacetyl reductase